MTGKTLVNVSAVDERNLKACPQFISWPGRALLFQQVMEKGLPLWREGKTSLGILTARAVSVLCVMLTNLT